MATDSVPPPPAAGGNLKYVIIGVVLLVAAGAVWLGMDACEPEPSRPIAQVTQDAGAPVERGGALADDDLIIPVPEPDAGPPRPDAGPRIRYVTRYVGGGNWDCSGSIPPAAARAALAQYNLQFRNCYERRLKVNNRLEGRVNVRMRVDRSGAVSAVAVGGTLNDSEVLSCVRGIANRIRFPAPTGGSCAVVQAPFNFTPRP
ncbi:MAG TPA: AgmX/PglI C-terminal domain-containing protein [Sandaracinaceae bacterium]